MSYSLHFIQNGDSCKAARTQDRYEFQTCIISDDGGITINRGFTDDWQQAMNFAAQLKFDESVDIWDWMVHYADGSQDFVFRSIWLEDGIPA